MTTAQVVETSATDNNCLIQDYVYPDDQTQPTFSVLTISLCFSPRENSSITVMWTSFYAASKRPEATSDGLHYGESITTLVITDV